MESQLIIIIISHLSNKGKMKMKLKQGYDTKISKIIILKALNLFQMKVKAHKKILKEDLPKTTERQDFIHNYFHKLSSFINVYPVHKR